MGKMNCDIRQSLTRLDKWLQAHDFEGYEPYDALTSYLRPLTFDNPLVNRILQQIVLRCPFHIRPLLGIRANKSASGMGLLARGYLRMWLLTENVEYKDKAVYCLEWLVRNQSSGYSGNCWGLSYDHVSRGGRLPKYTPNVVSTSMIGQAFLDAHEILGDRKYLEVAVGICTFILKELPREETANGNCISYVPFAQRSIHNSSMLAAAVLARTAKHASNELAVNVAKDAVRYTCERQLANGAWYYGEASQYHWIDNWHTAYNLDSLKCYLENTHDESYEHNLKKGLGFYVENFFEDSGKPKYYFDRQYLVDIQCAAQAIDTLSYFADYDMSMLELALKVADWTIQNMQDKRGYFYYRKLRWKKVKIPMVRWGQATMFCSLTHLIMQAGKTEVPDFTGQSTL